jgi:hypothetical protein
MSFVAIEPEAGGEGAAQPAEAGHRTLLPPITAYLEAAGARDVDLDLVSLLQLQSLDHRGRKTNREAVSPSSDLHGSPLPRIYVATV